jgi:hypothetical protein
LKLPIGQTGENQATSCNITRNFLFQAATTKMNADVKTADGNARN